MATALTALSAQVSGVTLAQLDTLRQDAAVTGGLVQGNATYSYAGPIGSYDPANVTAIVTLQPVTLSNTGHQGAFLDQLESLVGFNPQGWTQD